MKKIIVAGGAGFIGSHLVDRLLTRNDVEKIMVVDNLWTGEIDNLAHIKDERVNVEICDIEKFQTDMVFDEVYHLASPAAPQWYAANPLRTISANVMGAFRLRDLMKADGRFCYTSTSEVYGDGEQSRSWGYVSDIVEGLERFFWRTEHDYRGPLNIGNNREISVIDVARYIMKLVPGSTITFLPPMPQDPTNRCPDLTIANKILPGWTCDIPYEQGVKMTMDWFAKQMNIDMESKAA